MSETSTRRTVVAFVPDLFFSSKIAAVAEAAGVAIEILDAAGVRARCAGAPAPGGGGPPDLVILDLAAGAAALELARALRASAGASLRIAGFLSHVDLATREAAIAAGVDPVLPRSAFVARLPALLRGD